MALTVEDGSGLSDADAFVSVDACDTYCTAHGLTDWTSAARSPADDDEAAIRRATTWLTTAFTYKGTRTNKRSQALAFPRTDCTDGEGNDIGADELPTEIEQACCIAAAYERANPGGLTPAVTLTDRVKRERVGTIEVEYAGAQSSADAARPVLTLVLDLIGGLLDVHGGSLFGSAGRA